MHTVPGLEIAPVPPPNRSRRMRIALSGAVLGLAVLAAGCGGGVATRATAPSPTPSGSPAESPTPADPEAYFKPLDGYRYVEVPQAVQAQASANFEGSGAASFITDFAMRSIVKEGEQQPVAVAMVVGIDPSQAALPGIEAGFARGVAGGDAGSDPQQTTVAGRDVFRVEKPAENLTFIVWQDGTALIALFGGDSAAIEETAAAFISANQ